MIVSTIWGPGDGKRDPENETKMKVDILTLILTHVLSLNYSDLKELLVEL